MKVFVAALFLLLLSLSTASASASYSQARSPMSVNISPSCCLKYDEKVLPRKLVVGYRKAFNCNLPAIILVTKKKREICTNPNNKLVQDYIKDPNLPLLPPRKLPQVKSI
ncbi:PREDICTED: C-C motif chemokine 16 [Myotis davidii]|uniref:C-C motif chemokine n=1 Tax=Myotis davidii TaxID=225400 RepID=L5MDC2_MYODS|nr:PREDICTED: C-C motif chemokine 16 [Myotis davidii]ELK35738.1 C-C motif chemokine 16 [Myotis davidii]